MTLQTIRLNCILSDRIFRFMCYLMVAFSLPLLVCNALFASDVSVANGAIAVDAYGGIAATADRSGLVRLFDVTIPDHPVQLSQFTIPRNLTGIVLAGNSLLVSGQGGVEILDITNTRSPQLRHSVELGAETTQVKAAGNLGYSAFGSTVVLFNIATGEVLDQRSYSQLTVDDLALAEDSVYVLSSDAEAGLELRKLPIQASLGSPTASWKSTQMLPSASGRLSLYAADNLVYLGGVSTGSGNDLPGLAIMQDLGSSFKTAGAPSQIDASTVRPSGGGLLAFTGSASRGANKNLVGILDISNPASTGKLLRSIQAAGPAYDLIFHGEYAYVAAGKAGLQVVPVARPNGTQKLPGIALETGTIAETQLTGSLMRLTADVSAADQVRAVDFYVNGKKVATDSSYPFEYRFFEADSDLAGSLLVSACAEDIDGNVNCTAPKEMNPKSSGGLKVVSVAPAAGTHTSRIKKFTVSAQFSALLDTSTVSLKNVTLVKLAQGKSPESAIALSGVSYVPASKSITLQPKSALAAGSYRATLASAIRSSGGSTLASGYTWSFDVDPATITWSSPISGDWNVAANWTGNAVPANGDNVVISMTPGVTVTLGSGSPEIENLTVGTANTLTISGGALSVVGTGSVSKLNLNSGSIGGPGATTVLGTMTWTGGGITGILNIPAKAALQINTPFNTSFYLTGGTINNSGTVNQSFAGTPGAYTGFQVSQGGVINNQAGGVWNLLTDVWVYPVGNSVVAFNNAGTFNKTGGTNSSLWSVPFSGSGPVNIQSGDLKLSGAFTGTLASPIAISAKAILDYGQGGTLAGGKVTGAGTMNFDASTTVSGSYSFTGLTQIQTGGGAVNFQSPTTIATLNLISGALAGAGPVTVTGTTNWTGGGVTGVLDIPAKATLQLSTPFNTSFYLTAGTINNSGTVNQSFSGTPGAYTGFQVSQGGVINNLVGGVWNVLTDVWVYPVGTSAVAFNNIGTFNKVGGVNASLWSVPIAGSGPINIQTGDLKLSGAFTGKLASPIAISAKAILDYGQGGTLDGLKVTGTGTMNFDASTTLSGTYSFTGLTQIQAGSGAVSFQNPTTIATLNLISGALAGAGPVTVTGTTNWTGGGVTGVLNIPVKATLQISTPFNSNFYLTAGTINNSGTVNQSFAGTPGAYVGFQVSQGGVINNLVGGVWNVLTDVWVYPVGNSAATFNNAGTFNKVGGVNTSLWSIPFSGAGPINVQSGDLKLNGIFTGKLAAPIAISAKAILDYGQGGTLDGGTVTGTGTMNFDASTTLSGIYSFTGLTQIQAGSGAVSFQNPTTIATLNLISGALAGAGPVTVTGITNWTGGGITGVLDIPAKATLQINTPFNSSFYLAAGTINNSGTVNQSFAGTPGAYTGLQVSQGGVINNLTGGVWNVLTDVWIYPVGSSAAVFNNIGTFNKTGGTNTSLWTVPFAGAGPINIQSGDLKLNGIFTGKLAASIAISAKATLDYGQGGTLDGAKVTGAGTMNFNASTIVSGVYSFAGLTQIQSGNGGINFQNPTTIAALNLISGALAGAGPVTVTGTTNWTGGGITGVLNIPVKATLQISTPFNSNFYLTAGTINNSGTVNQSFAGTPGAYTGFQVSQGGVINNLTGGVWNVLTDVWVYAVGNSTVAFNNTGIFNKTGGTNTSTWSLPFNNTGTANLNTGSTSLTGIFPTSQLSGTINIAAAAALAYAQQGTLTNGKVNGAGQFTLTPASNNGTNSITGTYQINVPAQVLGGTLNVKAGATLDASNLTLTNATFTVDGNTSIGKLNVTASNGNTAGSTVAGAGSINVTDTLTWTGGSVDVTGSFNIQNMTLASNSAISFKLGSSALSVTAKLSLNGTLTLTPTGSNPAVGTVFKVLNFANNYLGDFADLSIPVLGTNDFLQENLTGSGLSFTVSQKQ